MMCKQTVCIKWWVAVIVGFLSDTANVPGPTSAEDATHYIDVTMTTIASQITSLTVVYSTVNSDADQRRHQSSASLAFVWGIQRGRWIPRTKGQLRGKCFHLMTLSCLAGVRRFSPENLWKVKAELWHLEVFVAIFSCQNQITKCTLCHEKHLKKYIFVRWFSCW